jgi:hypothetical protein
MRRCAVFALVASCAARSPEVVQAPSSVGTAAPPSVALPRTPVKPGRLEEALSSLSGPTRCDDFDYFPLGGIRSFFCHRPDSISIVGLRAASGMEIFATGPHAHDSLRLEEPSDFGHYDPAFVRWLVDNAAPSPRGSPLQTSTQHAYDTVARPLADVFWKTHLKIERDRECFLREKTLYESAIVRKTLPKDYYERWFFFMNPFFCDRAARGLSDDRFYFDNAFDGGVDGNVTKTVVGFWLRRAIDGTIAMWVEGLKSLLAAYEPEILALGTRPPDTAAIARALDAGLLASAACKDPQSTVASSGVQVVFAPDGSVQSVRLMLRGPAAACVEGKFASLRVPAFDGEALRFLRDVPLK